MKQLSFEEWMKNQGLSICSSCGGKGETICSECSGNGEIMCIACGHTHECTNIECGGSGFIPCYDCDEVDYKTEYELLAKSEMEKLKKI